MKKKEHDGDGPPIAPLPAVAPGLPPLAADHSDPESPLPTALGRSDHNRVAGSLLIFCLLLMVVFPLVVLKRSVNFYKAAGDTAPESALLSKVDEIAAALGNRNVAARWGSFDRSVSRWAKCTLVLDLAMAACSAWIGYNLFIWKPRAAIRAKQFMLAVALWAIVRDLLLPWGFGLDVEGNRLTMIAFLAAALAGYVYLQRRDANTRRLSTRLTGT